MIRRQRPGAPGLAAAGVGGRRPPTPVPIEPNSSAALPARVGPGGL